MTDYTELQKAAEYAAQDTIKFADEEEEMRALQSIESQLKADEEIGEQHLMTKGEGDYLLAVTYDDGETDDYGRVIHSPYWDVSVIGFRTFDEVISQRVAGSGEQP